MNNIKQARMNANMSQKEVALSLGVSGPTVSEWESGKKKPSTANLKALAQLFSVSSDYLLGMDEENTPTPKDEREFDDFTYAMQAEAEHLTDTDKQILISMAKQLAGKAKNGET